MVPNGSAVGVCGFACGRQRDLEKRLGRHVAAALIVGALGACNTADRLSQVGATPALSAIEDPTTQPGYKPVRQSEFGDILTIKVNVTDKANLANETKRSRTDSESFGLPNALGLENNAVGKAFGVGSTALLSAKSATANDGAGSVQRAETVTTNVAAVVTQVLPNGNLVVEGKQEIRVNFEIRELIVAGVARPEDIESDNTIDSAKIAQARIAYGGRGQITDVQQPRYGQQIVDILLPF